MPEKGLPRSVAPVTDEEVVKGVAGVMGMEGLIGSSPHLARVLVKVVSAVDADESVRAVRPDCNDVSLNAGDAAPWE